MYSHRKNSVEIVEERMRDRVTVEVSGEGNRIVVERGVTVAGRLSILVRGNRNRVLVREGTKIERDLSVVILPGASGVEMDDGFVEIGERCQFNGGEVLLYVGEPSTGIKVGDDCLFAERIRLRTSDNHGIYDNITNERVNKGASIEIADRVWLCEGVCVMKGVRVAEDTVLGLGSVVSRSCGESGVVIAGNPARVVRRGVIWKRDTR